MILHEETLVEHCLKGKRKAQEQLYQRYYPELYRISMRYLSDHYEAEDVLIQAFIKVFQNLHKFQFQGNGSLGKWIRTILINEALKQLNRNKHLTFISEVEQLNSIEHDTFSAIEQLQAEDIVKLIEQLPSGYRVIFNLYVIEGYTHKEIAELLSISESTSKTQLMKARKALMNRIKKEERYGIQ